MDKVETLENSIRLWVICLREEHAHSCFTLHALATLVPRPVRANQAKRGGLERSATLEWQMTSQNITNGITEDDRDWGCVSAADQSEGVAPRLL